MTAEQIQILDALPMKVLSNIVADYASEETAMTASTFLLGMQPAMRTCEPVDLLDWCCAKIRGKLIERLKQRGY